MAERVNAKTCATMAEQMVEKAQEALTTTQQIPLLQVAALFAVATALFTIAEKMEAPKL